MWRRETGTAPTPCARWRAGAYDFYEKPIEIDVLRAIVDRAWRIHQLESENRRLAEAPGPSPIARIITDAEAMLKVCRSVERLAAANVPVLLLGESGTGKEALARACTISAPARKQPFIAINCGAIPENLLESELFGHERGAFTGAVKQTIGKIESADRGTLFLDEIGDLPHPLQVKLLRFLQDQVVERIGGRKPIQVDVRIVSATNQLLETQITTAGSARISSTASTPSRSGSRLCASARRPGVARPLLPPPLQPGIRAQPARADQRCQRRHPEPIHGPATSASWKTA